MQGSNYSPQTAIAPEAESLYMKARECLRRNRFEDAQQLLEGAVRNRPDDPRYLSMLGVAYAYGSARHREAENLCRRAVLLSPRDPDLYCNLGRVLRLDGRRGEAHEAFMKAHKIDRRHAGAAAELTRLGIRRRPVLSFLPRDNFLNVLLGKARARMSRKV
jgi:Flp pilus assembly protein TadD